MSNDSANLETPSVDAQVDPTTARLGDLVKLSIRVSHDMAFQVEPPALAKELGTFEVYASTRLAAEISGTKAVERFEATLQNFTTGQQTLPALEFIYKDPMGKPFTLKTSTLVVTITEVPAGPKDKGDIRSIKGVVGPTAWSPWWWVVAAAFMCGVGLVLWYKRKRTLKGPPPLPPVPPDILAMEKLESLLRCDWLATGKIKEFYIALSDIVRAYIEGSFHTPALERTTAELMRDLRKVREIPMPLQVELKNLLENCDLVKFAKFRPEVSEATEAHKKAVSFIEATRAEERRP